MEDIREIAVLRLGAMGDILFASALLRGLRRRHPGARIHFLCLDKWAFLPRRNPNVDRVLALRDTHAETARRQWGGRRLDLLINLQELEMGAAIASALPARERRGLCLDQDGRLVPSRPEDARNLPGPEALRQLNESGSCLGELFCEIGGVETDSPRNEYHVRPLDRLPVAPLRARLRRGSDPLLAVHLHSRGGPLRCWNASDAAPVLRELGKQARLLVLGYKPDRAATAPLEALPRCRVSYHPITRQAALLECCDAFLGIDSGPRNLASALGLPSVCLMGPLPYGISTQLPGESFLYAPLPPENETHRVGAALARIPAADILEATRRCLTEARR